MLVQILVLPIVEALDGRRGFDVFFRGGGAEIVRVARRSKKDGGIVHLVNAKFQRT